MRILYGVSGDGLGHSIRSALVAGWLEDQGHDVRIVVSRDGVDYMEERFSDVVEIWGMTAVTEDNRLQPGRTFWRNLREGVTGLPKNLRRFVEVSADYDPDVVITDFETWSCIFATVHRKPLVSVDHLQFVPRCQHDPRVLEGFEEEMRTARRVMSTRVPWASHYVISSFCQPPPRDSTTSLVPPLLRPEVRDVSASDGDHLLVYQTSYSSFDFVGALRQLDVPVRMYGLGREIDGDVERGNVTLRPFSETAFIEDLASARAVVASAGYNLISEALHFRKPYFAVPVLEQYEQMLNARYIEVLDYGTASSHPTPEAIGDFLDRLPRYRSALEHYSGGTNEEVFEHVESVLQRVVS